MAKNMNNSNSSNDDPDAGRAIDYQAHDQDEYQVENRQNKQMKPPRRRRPEHTRNLNKPKSFNGIHRRRRKKII